MVDCLIVGSGVAAISAALTLKSNGKSFCVFGSKNLSEKISKAEKIENYPGLSSVTGKAFCDCLKGQIAAAGIEIDERRVTGVYAMKNKVALSLTDGSFVEGKTAIICSGVETTRRLIGEEEFLGRGVSYCATCDGFLYKGKTIAVISTSKQFEHEVKYLADLAAKTYFIPLYKADLFIHEKTEVLKKAPKSIQGEKRVERLTFFAKDGEDGVSVDGVFLLKESISPKALVGGIEMADGHIQVDRKNGTNLTGIFAAGDVTGRPYQYAKAVGEGNVAAHSVVEYLAKNSD